MHALTILLLLVLTACGRSAYVETDAYVDSAAVPCGFAKGACFAVKPRKSDGSLAQKEMGSKIERALLLYGYRTSPDSERILYYDVAVEEKQTTVSVPHYVPGEGETRLGSVTSSQGSLCYRERTESDGKIVYCPEQKTVYEISMSWQVECAGAPIWESHATVCRSYSDVRPAASLLIPSLMFYFGKSSGRCSTIEIDCDNPLVKCL